jgi:glucose/arabinose dehydrogenase
MNMLSTVRVLTAIALACLSSSLLAAITLTPVVSSGLSSPIFVGHAGDGSNRLFIAERGGIIRVVQPGAPTASVFLNIQTRIVAGGERGLLGLAFHPDYASNGRFFVFYTRASDGDIVVAEYQVSADPNVADPAETVLLTIEHSANTNHNGGMLAFGPDDLLYIGVGDGGGGNDPPNNAQNIGVLLGKILRIDVDRPDSGAGTPYSSPPDNPFVGEDGRDEIYALGWRNPWRFSFDRMTGAQWVADVGQGAREEVDAPVINGGNYGWRVYEGFACTNNDPSLCTPVNYIPPVFDYAHTNGRCSITGGYVYRGSQGALPAGTYVYGDYCTGEIFAWDGSVQSVLLDTAMNISSFGEDEQGEIYVVNLGGTVSRIVSAAPPCTYAIDPASRNIGSAADSGSVTVTAGTGCGWTAVPNAAWLRVTSCGSGSGNGAVGYAVDANTGASARTGTLTIAGHTFTVDQSAPPPPPCTYAITPTSATFTRVGGMGSVAVTTAAGCAWTAVSNASWITPGAGGGTGAGTVTYNVSPYTGKPKNRNGTMTIAGQTFSVKQSK